MREPGSPASAVRPDAQQHGDRDRRREAGGEREPGTARNRRRGRGRAAASRSATPAAKVSKGRSAVDAGALRPELALRLLAARAASEVRLGPGAIVAGQLAGREAPDAHRGAGHAGTAERGRHGSSSAIRERDLGHRLGERAARGAEELAQPLADGREAPPRRLRDLRLGELVHEVEHRDLLRLGRRRAEQGPHQLAGVRLDPALGPRERDPGDLVVPRRPVGAEHVQAVVRGRPEEEGGRATRPSGRLRSRGAPARRRPAPRPGPRRRRGGGSGSARAPLARGAGRAPRAARAPGPPARPRGRRRTPVRPARPG